MSAGGGCRRLINNRTWTVKCLVGRLSAVLRPFSHRPAMPRCSAPSLGNEVRALMIDWVW